MTQLQAVNGTAPEPILCILVLTRHRPILVTRLIMQLIGLVRDCGGEGGRVCILVSDSSRDDRTFEALKSLSARVAYCTVRKASQSFATTEEHLHDALGAAKGRYVWSLADDDLPTDEAVRHILAVIERHQPEIILINPPIVSHANGELLHAHFVSPRFLAPANGQDLVTTYRDIICHVGLIHLNCLVSALVFRREAALAADWQRYFAFTPIYAHSMALLEAFHGSRAVFTNRHIFSYRQGAIETNNKDVLDRLSKGLNVSDIYFWTSALSRFLVLAVSRGFISQEELPLIREVHWDDRAFYLTPYINGRVAEKLIADLQAHRSRLPLTARELEMIEQLLVYLPPDQLGVFERTIGLARAVYPLILSGGHATDHGYGDLSRELALFAQNEQDALWQEVSSWARGQLGAVERDLAKLQAAVR